VFNLRDMAIKCSICGCKKDNDEYVSCPAHSFGEVEDYVEEIPGFEGTLEALDDLKI
jgi:hypothetical protein